MSSLVFIADDSTQSTSTTISGASTYIPVYALATNLNSLSTNSILSINHQIQKRYCNKYNWYMVPCEG
jgi:hypothetical protein